MRRTSSALLCALVAAPAALAQEPAPAPAPEPPPAPAEAPPAEAPPNPAGDVLLYGQASLLMHREEHERALALFERLLAEHPGTHLRAEARFWQGHCLERLGRRADAARAYEQILAEVPGSRWADDARERLELTRAPAELDRGLFRVQLAGGGSYELRVRGLSPDGLAVEGGPFAGTARVTWDRLERVEPAEGAPAYAGEVVVLENGDRVTGRFVGVEGRMVLLESPACGTVRLPQSAVIRFAPRREGTLLATPMPAEGLAFEALRLGDSAEGNAARRLALRALALGGDADVRVERDGRRIVVRHTGEDGEEVHVLAVGGDEGPVRVEQRGRRVVVRQDGRDGEQVIVLAGDDGEGEPRAEADEEGAQRVHVWQVQEDDGEGRQVDLSVRVEEEDGETEVEIELDGERVHLEELPARLRERVERRLGELRQRDLPRVRERVEREVRRRRRDAEGRREELEEHLEELEDELEELQGELEEELGDLPGGLRDLPRRLREQLERRLRRPGGGEGQEPGDAFGWVWDGEEGPDLEALRDLPERIRLRVEESLRRHGLGPDGRRPHVYRFDQRLPRALERFKLQRPFHHDGQHQLWVQRGPGERADVDRVHLDNGDVLSGEVLSVDAQHVRLKTSYGEVTIQRGKVLRITFKRPLAAIRGRHDAAIMQIPGVVGVGEGQDALVIYLERADREEAVREALPQGLEEELAAAGLDLKLVVTGPLRPFGGRGPQVAPLPPAPPEAPGPRRPFLGISGEPHPDGGVSVTQVYEGTAAAQAGLEPGDRILELDGEAVRDLTHLAELLRQRELGAKVRLTIARGDARRELEAELSARPAEVTPAPPPRAPRAPRPPEGAPPPPPGGGGFAPPPPPRRPAPPGEPAPPAPPERSSHDGGDEDMHHF